MSALKCSKFFVVCTFLFSALSAKALPSTVGEIWDTGNDYFSELLKGKTEDAQKLVIEEQRKLEIARAQGPKAFQDQLAKARVTLNTKLINLDKKYVGFKLYAKQKIEPSYLPKLQQRTDVWNIELDLHSDQTQALGFSLKPGMNLTYVRHFDSIWSAMKADYLWYDHVPWTAERAIEKLKTDEVMRMELFLDAGLGASKTDDGAKTDVTFGLGVNRSARMLLDVYRLDGQKVRLRGVVLRNDGTINWSAMAALDGIFNTGSSLVRKALGRLFKCVPFEIGGEHGLGAGSSYDSFMVDYVVDLSTQNGKDVYNNALAYVRSVKGLELLSNVRGLIFSLNRAKAYQILRDELGKIIAPAEARYAIDHHSDGPRVVDRLFKGESQTSVDNSKFDSQCLRIWELKNATYNARTKLTSYDSDDRQTYTIFESTLLENTSKYLSGYFERIDNSSMNAAFEAGKDFAPKNLTDMLATINLKDSSFSNQDLADLKTRSKAILPTLIYNQIDWSKISSGGTKTLLKFRMDLIFSEKTVAAFKPISSTEHRNGLQAYFESFPGNDYLDCDPVPGGSCDSGSSNYRREDRFSDDIRDLSFKLSTVFNKESDPQQRLDQFKDLRTNKLFQQIGIGYLMKLLEKDATEPIDKLVTVRIASNDNDNNSMDFINGDDANIEAAKRTLKRYLNIEYQLSLINDRSLDMRIEKDQYGHALRSGDVLN